MPKHLLNQINWWDIIFIILLLRTTYIGIKRGLVTEIFKIVGVIVAIFISLHYYSKMGNFISFHTFLPLALSDFISFLGLVILVSLVFRYVRDVFLLLVRIEPHTALDRWGGAIIGIVRGILISNLIILTTIISTVSYLRKSSVESLSGPHIYKVAPNIYRFTFENIISKFFPKENFNQQIFEAIK